MKLQCDYKQKKITLDGSSKSEFSSSSSINSIRLFEVNPVKNLAEKLKKEITVVENESFKGE
jgi:hypothetical protein